MSTVSFSVVFEQLPRLEPVDDQVAARVAGEEDRLLPPLPNSTRQTMLERFFTLLSAYAASTASAVRPVVLDVLVELLLQPVDLAVGRSGDRELQIPQSSAASAVFSSVISVGFAVARA